MTDTTRQNIAPPRRHCSEWDDDDVPNAFVAASEGLKRLAKNPIQRIFWLKNLSKLHRGPWFSHGGFLSKAGSAANNIQQIWEGQRRTRLSQLPRSSLKHGDIVVNERVAGYRNNGVYIVYAQGAPPTILELSDFPDDYGSIPPWMYDSLGDDMGASYSEGMVDHNAYVPLCLRPYELVRVELIEESLEVGCCWAEGARRASANSDPGPLTVDNGDVEVGLDYKLSFRAKGPETSPAEFSLYADVTVSDVVQGGIYGPYRHGCAGGDGQEWWSERLLQNGEKQTHRYKSVSRDGRKMQVRSDVPTPRRFKIDADCQRYIEEQLFPNYFSATKGIIYAEHCYSESCEVNYESLYTKDGYTVVVPTTIGLIQRLERAQAARTIGRGIGRPFLERWLDPDRETGFVKVGKDRFGKLALSTLSRKE